MAVRFKEGSNIGGFVVEKCLGSGNFAISYLARDGRGTPVFLKQYKSPSPSSGWLEGYIAYQQQLKTMIEADPGLALLCIQFIEFFKNGKYFAQAFEFVEGGFDLKTCIAEKSRFDWETRVVFAKVMLHALDQLHKKGIVHTDLKPENLYILPDSSIALKYKLRLIDLDFAVISGKKAPWDGFMGYVCTEPYGSPEHARGQVPSPASDVFTCGLMLGELLGDGHPLRNIPSDDISKATAKIEGFLPVKLEQEVQGGLPRAELEAVIARCFESDPRKRPTCGELLQAFNANVVAGGKGLLVLQDGTGHEITLKITMELGRRNFAPWGADAQFLSSPQFRFVKKSDGWLVEPVVSATNKTMLDGKELTSAQELGDGMVLTVGNPSKGIEKFPIKVKLS